MGKAFLVIVAGIFMYSPRSMSGGVTSNGGDSVAAEFTKIGRQITEIIRTQKDFPVKASDFSRVIAGTWVVSKNRTVLNGQEVEAINTPRSRRIEINRKRWLENKDALRRRYVLVAHEYFGILGVDDSRYQISEKLFEIPGVARHTIRCKAFADGVLNFDPLGDEFFLEINTYDRQSIALIKNASGLPLPLRAAGIGETMMTGSLDLNPVTQNSVKALISVNLGFSIRMVQIQIDREITGRFTGQRWDLKADAQVSPITAVNCDQTNW